MEVYAQMVECVRGVHGAGYLHRDIKPMNIMVDKIQGDVRLYLIDYGLSQYYVRDQGRVPYFVGSYAFASLNAHLRNAQSKRDDLESLFYSMVYCELEYLPWERLFDV